MYTYKLYVTSTNVYMVFEGKQVATFQKIKTAQAYLRISGCKGEWHIL